MLLARGWPARVLLLSEVKLASGEHHLVLVVRASNGDFVLDNLTSRLQVWNQTPYQWLRMQSVANPNFWTTVARA
jgi:predicted transglutaminase-like cysteine proteinase